MILKFSAKKGCFWAILNLASARSSCIIMDMSPFMGRRRRAGIVQSGNAHRGLRRLPRQHERRGAYRRPLPPRCPCAPSVAQRHRGAYPQHRRVTSSISNVFYSLGQLRFARRLLTEQEVVCVITFAKSAGHHQHERRLLRRTGQPCGPRLLRRGRHSHRRRPDDFKSLFFGSDFPEEGVRVTRATASSPSKLHIKKVGYGLNIATIVQSITHKVKHEVENATGLKVERIEVSVDISWPTDGPSAAPEGGPITMLRCTV